MRTLGELPLYQRAIVGAVAGVGALGVMGGLAGCEPMAGAREETTATRTFPNTQPTATESKQVAAAYDAAFESLVAFDPTSGADVTQEANISDGSVRNTLYTSEEYSVGVHIVALADTLKPSSATASEIQTALQRIPDSSVRSQTAQAAADIAYANGLMELSTGDTTDPASEGSLIAGILGGNSGTYLNMEVTLNELGEPAQQMTDLATATSAASKQAWLGDEQKVTNTFAIAAGQARSQATAIADAYDSASGTIVMNSPIGYKINEGGNPSLKDSSSDLENAMDARAELIASMGENFTDLTNQIQSDGLLNDLETQVADMVVVGELTTEADSPDVTGWSEALSDDIPDGSAQSTAAAQAASLPALNAIASNATDITNDQIALINGDTDPVVGQLSDQAYFNLAKDAFLTGNNTLGEAAEGNIQDASLQSELSAFGS